MACSDFKDLPRRTASGIVLRDKAFNIAENPKYVGYQHGLASMVYNFFDKKSPGSAVTRVWDTLVMQDKSAIRNDTWKCQTNNYLKNYTKKLLENSKNVKYIHLLKPIFADMQLNKNNKGLFIMC